MSAPCSTGSHEHGAILAEAHKFRAESREFAEGIADADDERHDQYGEDEEERRTQIEPGLEQAAPIRLPLQSDTVVSECCHEVWVFPRRRRPCPLRGKVASAASRMRVCARSRAARADPPAFRDILPAKGRLSSLIGFHPLLLLGGEEGRPFIGHFLGCPLRRAGLPGSRSAPWNRRTRPDSQDASAASRTHICRDWPVPRTIP